MPLQPNDNNQDSLLQNKNILLKSLSGHRFFNLTSMSAGVGLGEVGVPYSNSLTGITNVSGYMLNPKLWSGIGIGLMNYQNETLLPLFLNGSYFFGKSKNNFFLKAEGGILFYVKGLDEGSRVFLAPELGMKLPFSANNSTFISAGMTSQLGITSKQRDTFLTLKFGFAIY